MNGGGLLDTSAAQRYQLTAINDVGVQLFSLAVTNIYMTFDLAPNARVSFTLSGIGTWLTSDGMRIPTNVIQPTTVILAIR